MNVDLHCHSTASDGALSPSVLVARAHEHGVQALALTDHD
ncbi:PHP domain-containing protein, partial [Paraburkholderia sp. SIMBA_055]